MSAIAAVALGGAVGAVVRYGLNQALSFPFSTVVVNVAGSFLIGLAFVALPTEGAWRALIMIGLLGSLTTFSSFSLDALRLVEAGNPVGAITYVFGSLALSLSAVFAAVWLARSVL